ncbi:MAG TPA: tetratricopeptide repeat protein [Gemmatimonadales bacterium]|nr:tetratricopeptide repeat protein [Gemmatimonadales bacterium]
MSDDIRALTARLAEEPSSLAFLELGEALRRRGQLEAAYKVARGGLSRYPALADAHDLMARILGDQGDLAGAFDAWVDALRFDPMRIGALKGIAFLYFRAGDVPAALEHLQRAADIDPDDLSIAQALARVRDGAPGGIMADALPISPSSNGDAALESAPAESSAVSTLESPTLENGDQGLMLVDGNGLRLTGTVKNPSSEDVGDRVAAELAGVSKEASRTSRLLGLGPWQAIAVESPEGNLFLVAPTSETLLLTVRGPSLPMARLGLIAERAAKEARAWLERQE